MRFSLITADKTPEILYSSYGRRMRLRPHDKSFEDYTIQDNGYLSGLLCERGGYCNKLQSKGLMAVVEALVQLYLSK